MVGNPIKFRCYKCNQLLGAHRSRAGAVIACTRCGAELIVPAPPDPVPAPEPEPATVSDVGIALDFQPEDIRVSPEFRDVSSAFSAEPEPAAPEPAPEPSPLPDLQPSPAARRPRPVRLAPTPPPDEDDADDDEAAVIELPGLSIDSEAPRRPRRPVPQAVRGRDLVIPRAVVASWSLFVILGLGFAFLAGLLAGHFVWRVH